MRTCLACLLPLLVPALGLAQGSPKHFSTPYYPLKVGTKWVYKSGMQNVTVEVEKEEPLVYVTKGKAGEEKKTNVVGYTLKFTSGDKLLTEQVAVLEDGVYRFQAAGKDVSPPLCFLKLPQMGLDKGTTWKVDSATEGTKIRGTIQSVGEEAVTVPAGQYQAIRIRTSDFQVGPTAMDIDSWYVPNVGLVKQRIRVGTIETMLDLEKAP